MVESLFIIIARRRETEQPRERKRAPSSFLAYSRYENRKTDELRINRKHGLSSAIVPTTPSERSQIARKSFHHHRSTPRNRPKIQRLFHAKKETQTQKRVYTQKKNTRLYRYILKNSLSFFLSSLAYFFLLPSSSSSFFPSSSFKNAKKNSFVRLITYI